LNVSGKSKQDRRKTSEFIGFVKINEKPLFCSDQNSLSSVKGIGLTHPDFSL